MNLKLPSLTHRRRRGDMIFTYKILTATTNMNKDFFAIVQAIVQAKSTNSFKNELNKY